MRCCLVNGWVGGWVGRTAVVGRGTLLGWDEALWVVLGGKTCLGREVGGWVGWRLRRTRRFE